MATATRNPIRIGRYEIIGVIGRGSRGTVYKAIDPHTRRAVAIKVLTSAFSEDDSLPRFYREAKYAGSLQHQNIVRLYELGNQNGFPYVVMEYLEGWGLDAVIGSTPLSIGGKLHIMVQVCGGLQFAHDRGIVHRDIKPANIVILPDGTAKIVDFGTAHIGGSHVSRPAMVMGNIFYTSPEQLNGKADLDCRTDIFSAGVVLFQLLTGALPFQGQDTRSTQLKILNDPAPCVGKYLSDVPSDLQPIIEKAMAKRREDRYSSARELGFELTRLQQQLSRAGVDLHLQRASGHIEGRDLNAAKQALIDALRVDPGHSEAKQRLRKVQEALDLQERKQAALELRSQAEQAMTERRFEQARSLADKALQLQPNDTGLLKLREAVQNRHKSTETYNTALDRAAAALNAGALDPAKQAIEDAVRVQALDSRGLGLARRIAERVEEQSREGRAAEQTKQVVIATNAVEKAIADARMFLSFNQRQEAREALVSAMSSALRVPVDLRRKFEALGRELEREPQIEDSLPDRSPDGRSLGSPTANELFSAPQALGPEVGREPKPGSIVPPRFEAMPTWRTPDPPEQRDIPEELREFLPPPRRGWGRLLAGTLVLVLAASAGYLIFLPQPKHVVKSLPPQPAPAPQVQYAEINAEPWGTVTSITSRTDQSVIKPNEVTPARISLAPGAYDVTVTGPAGQTRTVEIQVPQPPGQRCFVVFTKPDLAKIVNAQSTH